MTDAVKRSVGFVVAGLLSVGTLSVERSAWGEST
jgi:hypothetical protein